MNKIEIDIHGMSVEEAKTYLQKRIKSIGPNTEEIVIVHGNNGGDKLAKMVRKDLKHKRIKQKILSLNAGITTLLIKKADS